MEDKTLITFERFNDQALAMEMAQVFEDNGIVHEIEDTSLNFDPSFSFNELDKEFRIKIKGVDFEKARHILEQLSLESIDLVDESHYLYSFTEEELFDIIQKSDEWSAFDVSLSKKILQSRGNNISTEKIEALKKERLSELAKPEDIKNSTLILGYLFAFLGGLLAFFIGWHIATHKKTLPDGTKIYNYSEKSRKHGNYMLIIGIVIFLFLILFKMKLI